MPDTTSNETHSESRERGRPIRGKFVLLALLGMIAMFMGIGWFALTQLAEDRASQAPLSWAERAGWPDGRVRATDLDASPIESFAGGQSYRELSLQVSDDVQSAIDALASLAASARFTDETTRQRIEAIHEEHPDLFYASYLLATWHRAHGNDAKADELFQQSFADAPNALQQRYTTADRNRAVRHRNIGRIDVICYRSDGQTTDASLRLVFPEVRTDERGAIYLPVYDTVCGIADRAEPAGFEATYGDPEMFQFPGRVGTLPVAVVESLPDDSPSESAERR